MNCIGCNNHIPNDARFCPKCGLSLRPAQKDPIIDQKLDNRYLVLEQLGEGGSGKVYMARHVNLGKRVAIKLLHGELLHDEKAVARFRKEALSVSELENSHIIKVFDLGQTSANMMYIAMEFLTGETLATRLARVERLTFAEVVQVMGEVCDGLMEAHAMGFIHRDLRPRNLMFTKHDGREDFVKILDFGLAKIITGTTDPSKSGIGFTLGDPTYTAPEQMKAQPVSPRTDIYSMGIIIYHLLTGHPPYSGNNILEIMAAHLDSPYPQIEGSVPGLPKGIDHVIAKCMAKNPEDRYATVSQLKQALTALLNAPKVPTSRESQRVNPRASYLNLERPPGLDAGPSVVRMAGGGVVRIPVGETFDGIGPMSQPIPMPTQVVPVGQQAAVTSKGAHTLLLGDDTPGSTKKVSYDQSTARDVMAKTPTPKDEVPPPKTETPEVPHHKKAGVVYGIEAPKVGQAPTAQLQAVEEDADDPQNSLLMAGPSETFIAKQDALIEIRATEIRKERLFWTGIIVGAVLLAGVIYFVAAKLMDSDDGAMEYKKGAPTTAPMDPPMQVATTMAPPTQPTMESPMVVTPPPMNTIPPAMTTPPDPMTQMAPEPSMATPPAMKTPPATMKKPVMESVMISVPMISIPTMEPTMRTSSALADELAKAKGFQNQGNYKAAYGAYKKMASRYGSNFTVMMGLASMAFELGKTAEAERALKKATRLRSSPRAWYKLGNARRKLGKTASAKAAYKKALSINPNYAPAKKALERMNK